MENSTTYIRSRLSHDRVNARGLIAMWVIMTTLLLGDLIYHLSIGEYNIVQIETSALVFFSRYKK